MMKRFFTCFFLCVFCFGIAYAQEDDSSSVSQSLKSFLGLGSPTIGALVQMKAYAYNEGSKMVTAGTGQRFYVSLHGDISKKLKYLAQGSFLDEYRLLDLKFSYDFQDYLGFDFGRMKTPFGREYVQNESNLMFARQSYLASDLGSQRQDGIQLRGKLFDSRFSYFAGIFGGKGITINSRTASLYVGKLSITPVTSSSVTLDVGGSIAYSDDRNDFYDQSYIYFYYPGTSRKFFNTDFRLKLEDLSFSGEYTFLTGSQRGKPEAFYLTAKNSISDQLEVCMRFDALSYPYNTSFYFDPIIYRYYTVGVNWLPEKDVKLQLNFEREPLLNYTIITLMFQYAVNQTND